MLYVQYVQPMTQCHSQQHPATNPRTQSRSSQIFFMVIFLTWIEIMKYSLPHIQYSNACIHVCLKFTSYSRLRLGGKILIWCCITNYYAKWSNCYIYIYAHDILPRYCSTLMWTQESSQFNNLSKSRAFKYCNTNFEH